MLIEVFRLLRIYLSWCLQVSQIQRVPTEYPANTMGPSRRHDRSLWDVNDAELGMHYPEGKQRVVFEQHVEALLNIAYEVSTSRLTHQAPHKMSLEPSEALTIFVTVCPNVHLTVDVYTLDLVCLSYLDKPCKL